MIHTNSAHEGIKPFKCNKCDYKTAQKAHLKKHVDSVHEGIKPYKCNICDYRTAEKTKLTIHTNSVHEKKKNKKNKSAKEIYEASLCTSNAVVSEGKKTKN